MVSLYAIDYQVDNIKYARYDLDHIFLIAYHKVFVPITIFLTINYIKKLVPLSLTKSNEHKYRDQVHQKRRHEPCHDIRGILLVQEFNNYHDVRSHKHLFILLAEQLLQELKPLLLVDYPVSSHALDVDSEGQALWVVRLFSHDLLEVHIVNITALAWGAH